MVRCRCLLESYAGGRDFALPGTQPSYGPDLGLEPTHLAIDLRVDLEAQSVSGSVTTTVRARRAGERTLSLDGVDLREVEVTSADAHGLTASYDGERVAITWDEAPAPGEERQVTVRYRVVRPLTGMLFSWPEEGIPDRGRWMATDHETERARYWLPCVDHPAVRTPLDIRLRVEAGLVSLANGVQVAQEEHDDGTRTTHWKLEQPCPSYLICVAVGDFVRAEGGTHAGNVEVAFFAPRPHRAEDLSRSFGDTVAMLDWMTDKLQAPFPYPKYYQLAASGIGGAMENISLVTWDDAFIVDERLHAEWGRIVERINVHEMAHSYFGDAIVIRDFAHAWLKESWATYIEALWVEDRYGTDELHCQLHREARDYMSESDERYARPIVTKEYSSSWDMFDQHLYPGGAWRIHMLRHVVGEEAFWAGVHDYVREHSGGLVETDDFRHALEARSGLSLDRFFDQWLRSPGYPRLKVDVRHDAEKGEARVTVEQTQKNDKKGIGSFAFDLEVAFEVADGEWQTVVLPVSGSKHSRIVPLPQRPLQTVVDPQMKVLHKLELDPGGDQLLRSLEAGPVTARIHAAETLAKKGNHWVEAVADAFRKEPQWGVKRAMAAALAKGGNQGCADALASLVSQELDPRVLVSLAEGCGRYRDAGIREALKGLLARDEVPYHAHAAALRSLGKQREDAPLDLLTAGAEDGSWWGWVRRGAMIGLGETRSEGARRFLMERVVRGREPLQVRTQAVLALGTVAQWQDDGARRQVLERLVDLTRDPDYLIRMHAARALGTLGEAGGVGALEAVSGQLAAQEEARIRRIISGIRRRDRGSSDAGAARKRVEELEGKLRKLVQRVEQLESRHNGGEA